MKPDTIKNILKKYKSGKLSLERAMKEFSEFPYSDLGIAKLDTHRSLRMGFPEVVLGSNKKFEHLVSIISSFNKGKENVLITRIKPRVFSRLSDEFPRLKYYEDARIAVLEKKKVVFKSKGKILVVTAGTSDISVAEEAYVVSKYMGNRVEKLYDVGVAGIHRLLDKTYQIQNASVIIVVAGMEGALASVVGGLTSKPVIAVPTSVGYGASFKGVTALLGMLNTCSPGVVTVNIDNGFGAGYFSSLINR